MVWVVEIYAAFTVKRTSLAETVSLKSNNYVKINLNKEMPLATGQFTSNFLMDIKKTQKKTTRQNNPQILFPNHDCKEEKSSLDFLFSVLYKNDPWIRSWWKVHYRNRTEYNWRGEVAHILMHMSSNPCLASGEFILTVYFQDSHQYNVWELNPSPTKSVPRLPLASTVQLWSLCVHCLQNELLLTQEKSQAESIQI